MAIADRGAAALPLRAHVQQKDAEPLLREPPRKAQPALPRAAKARRINEPILRRRAGKKLMAHQTAAVGRREVHSLKRRAHELEPAPRRCELPSSALARRLEVALRHSLALVAPETVRLCAERYGGNLGCKQDLALLDIFGEEQAARRKEDREGNTQHNEDNSEQDAARIRPDAHASASHQTNDDHKERNHGQVARFFDHKSGTVGRAAFAERIPRIHAHIPLIRFSCDLFESSIGKKNCSANIDRPAAPAFRGGGSISRQAYIYSTRLPAM